MSSLLLDTVNWDLCVDAQGNIAVADEPYSLAQDAACQLRLFQGELRYDTTQGVPYFQDILGHWPSISVLRAYLTQQALLATRIATANVFITSWQNRAVGGAVELTSVSGQTVTAAFTTFAVPPAVGSY